LEVLQPKDVVEVDVLDAVGCGGYCQVGITSSPFALMKLFIVAIKVIKMEAVRELRRILL
jgi:hypothetical protein